MIVFKRNGIIFPTAKADTQTNTHNFTILVLRISKKTIFPELKY